MNKPLKEKEHSVLNRPEKLPAIRNRSLIIWFFLAFLLVLASIGIWQHADSKEGTGHAGNSYITLLRGNTAQSVSQNTAQSFSQVSEPRELVFPRDHGAHPDYRVEWWYVTGNLQTTPEPIAIKETLSTKNAKTRAIGFQLTLFRFALATSEGKGWNSPQVYMGHFALTDSDTNRHYQFERFSREGAGLAGVSENPDSKPLRVWLENWELRAHQAPELFPASLSAMATDKSQGVISLNLTLDTHKPVVLQGDRGYSPKNATPGNASHYYSYTRLGATGQVQIGEQKLQVSGNAWLDREWSSSSLGKKQVGWDWFALQLDDGRDLMFYRLRQAQQKTDPFSRGVLVAADGSYLPIGPSDIQLTPLSYWQSPGSSRYPLEWQLQLPSAGLDLTIEPLLRDQEWRQRYRYWEGAVRVTGSHLGRGYLELTGY